MSRLGGLIAVLLVTGCAPADRGPKFRPAGATTPRDGGTLRFAVIAQVPTLDPTIGYDDVSYFILHPLFDTLVDFSTAGDGAPDLNDRSSDHCVHPESPEIVPRLAECWDVSPDGLVYTFVLRSGITFSDGTPITAAHFKYSLERALATSTSPFAEVLRDIDGASKMLDDKASACAGIVAAGDRLVIKLVHANAALLDILAMPFATPQRPEHVTATGDQLRRKPDATGPFELASWDEGQRIELKRNPHYFDQTRAHLDAIVMLENIPRDTQFQMFERGELDTAETLTAPDYLFVMSDPAWQPYVHQSAGRNAFGSRMNVRVKPFNDRRVRQALNYALNKTHTERLLHKTTVAAHGILPPGMLGFDSELMPYRHDVPTARALLAEAGYPDGFDVDYLTNNDEETETVAESLQSDLAEAGIRVHIIVASWPTYQTEIGRESGSAFSLASWTADFPDPIDFFDVRFHSRSIKPLNSQNDSFYQNPELDALLDDARRELDRDKRAAIYRRAERILYEDAPWIWDYHRLTTEVTQPYVRSSAVTQPYVRDYKPHPIWQRDYTSAWLDVGPDSAPVAR